MAVTLIGTDEDGHPLAGRVPDDGTCVVLFTGSDTCAIDRLSRELADAVDGTVVIVDVDADPTIATHFKVRVLPTWQVWVDGRVKRNETGAMSVTRLEDLLGTGGIDRSRGMRRRR